MERVCIVGAGVIGSLFAGHLADVSEVSVLTRRREHADALNRDGLRVSGKSDRLAVAAVADPDELPPFEVAIVATKASGLESAAQALEGRFPDAVVVTVLNGIGAEEVVRSDGDWSPSPEWTFMSGTRHSDTHVEYILDTETWLGPYEATLFEVVQDIADTIVRSGLHAEALPDFSARAVVEADLQRRRQPGRSAHGPATRLTSPRRTSPRTSVISSISSSTRGRRSPRPPVSSFTTTPWKMNVLATRRSAHYPSMLEDTDARSRRRSSHHRPAGPRGEAGTDAPVPLHAMLYALVRGKEAPWQAPKL